MSAGGLKREFTRKANEQLQYLMEDNGALKIQTFAEQTVVRSILYAPGTWRTIETEFTHGGASRQPQ